MDATTAAAPAEPPTYKGAAQLGLKDYFVWRAYVERLWTGALRLLLLGALAMIVATGALGFARPAVGLAVLLIAVFFGVLLIVFIVGTLLQYRRLDPLQRHAVWEIDAEKIVYGDGTGVRSTYPWSLVAGLERRGRDLALRLAHGGRVWVLARAFPPADFAAIERIAEAWAHGRPPLGVPVLETERLILAAPTAADVGEVARLADDYGVAKNLTRMPTPYTEADARHFIEEVAPGEWVWKATLRATGAPIGVVGLAPLDRGAPMELGYWYGRAYWGQGYATEAGRAVLAYAFDRLGAARVNAGCFAFNDASANVLAKLGFVETGRSTRHSRAQEQELPHIDMTLPRDAFRRAPEDAG